MKREQWTVEDFKKFVVEMIVDYYWVSPSAVTLASFYQADVIKPKDVTIRTVNWLRSIADKEIQIYKTKHNKKQYESSTEN
mgnify:CR=1 FL=1